ncbi:uncharacterized protein BDZ83DRAFT_651223 [Colletotrichum acutatum]|uniref:Uncharacterized protein n=1 Tax=Glomerella acutata TaxID=27357 RepID=A0AAD8UQY5_GLOAC|nr:uncharacterized protein BDZ83DRAFT_651223 [Colletotrichum acutatum]KAK1725589.1 hypothetical protein BDZ83DRAFT_651223 [Colletotrichum acutatum]
MVSDHQAVKNTRVDSWWSPQSLERRRQRCEAVFVSTHGSEEGSIGFCNFHGGYGMVCVVPTPPMGEVIWNVRIKERNQSVGRASEAPSVESKPRQVLLTPSSTITATSSGGLRAVFSSHPGLEVERRPAGGRAFANAAPRRAIKSDTEDTQKLRTNRPCTEFVTACLTSRNPRRPTSHGVVKLSNF